EIGLVAQHLELDEIVAIKQLARQAQRAHRLLCGVAAGGVGQYGVARRRQHVERAGFVGVLADVGAPDGYRDDLGTARLDGASGFVEILVFARTYEQPGTVFRAGDVEGVCVRRVCLGLDWCGAGCRVAGAAWPAGDRSRIVYFRPAPVTVVSLMAGIAQSRWPRRGHAICLA